MKGLFIPEITTEMFRTGCLESIEALMAEGEIYDIEYEPKRKTERKTGKWKDGESIYFCGKRHYMPMTCSCCGRSALNEPWKFCPNCGARMEEA